MAKHKDIIGNIYGRLTVLARAKNGKNNRACWEVVCLCGSKKIVRGSHLISGHTGSCGCLNVEMASKRNMSHGNKANGEITGAYRSWTAMKQRCQNPNAANFKRYGGRGIKVHPLWDSFENFLAHMGPRPPGTSIDRIDPNGNYEPGNCRWATAKEQNNNKRKKAA